ncbi:hypothetical protein Mtc_1622 [Methanocella conradii HZ254]|uniref:Uncharacterized protein n=1 Tax=Methanocella conradii (strain DSM 24694 / JCM 17849 / CGMCC 1.5162 / HZ254) TaxID=1041930 RepID=H8I7X2_METCZ|nr:hypothetical protein [Methanocella conradii]AFD00372.1 hypothetical protein Mtc_1622 [Methanocella conradii HZ254]MDI6895805.1 hypothetical protein [Methanocella conradii]
MIPIGMTMAYCALMENGQHWMPTRGPEWTSIYMTIFYILLLLLLFGLVIYVYLWILKLWKSMSSKQ